MTRKDKFLLLAIIAVLALVAVHAFVSVDFVKRGRTVISRVELKNLDPANNGINIEVVQPWYNPMKELSFNVGEPDERNFDRFDVTRCLLQCAQQLGERDFSRIYLCNRGDRLYYINADDFKQLGEQYKTGETLNKYNIPVCYDFPASHDENWNYPLIEGCPATMNVTPEGVTLTFEKR